MCIQIMEQTRPTKGYKAVIRYGAFRWYILELDIPDSASIVHSGGGFYRTDMAVPVRLLPTRTKLAIIDTAAHSWFDKEFVYTLGATAYSKLDTNSNTDCAAGIHFFETLQQAENWGNANFGISAAV